MLPLAKDMLAPKEWALLSVERPKVSRYDHQDANFHPLMPEA